ncbi:DNA glycosylase AlkZ-like family protein [Arthrobacter sp. PsM3]|uniref:DNA glycosylase AlkZ-like family protein n=1 Tax=Arthrobacter sp. PsM3 TaxID=3030531 RepID=UPI00263B98E4|nr:crosslink repair DNA glycosylase YcaQ family protein [Arthrobacter sp. PsM3]MDN4642945.1 crosslink repair DNA glycosylase YcaQ family protein [Arthrobacter sp. PsM3]
MTPEPLTTQPLTANAPPARTLTRERLRAWAWHKQGLDGSLAGCTPEQVFARAGWARSVGGANPYLTLFARAGIRRTQVDADVDARRILELPTARGCTYVLGRDDFAWALRLGRDAAEAAVKVVGRLGVDRGEITLLEEQVLHTLAEAAVPMDPRQLKEELGESVRNLGEEGKKKGATTTLPTALGILQSQGRIRRVPANGRLDQQRYAYELWDLPPSPLDDDEARTELVRRYLGWTGGATFKQSQWFTAFTVAQSKASLAAAGAVEVPTAAGETLWMLPDDVERLAAFREPAGEQIQLLAGTDSLALLRRNAADMLAEEDRHTKALGSLALQADLPDHPIFDRGRIIGLWQYDPGRERIVPWVFHAATPAVTRRIAEVEEWIREDLGDFRAFGLDSPATRQQRIDGLAAAAAGPAAGS